MENNLENILLSKELLLKETLPEETLPKETLSEETLPKEALSEETLPKETLPEETLPKETLHEETSPEEETVPEEETGSQDKSELCINMKHNILLLSYNIVTGMTIQLPSSSLRGQQLKVLFILYWKMSTLL